MLIYILARSFVDQFGHSQVIDRRGQYRGLFGASSESDDDPYDYHSSVYAATNNVIRSLRNKPLHPWPVSKSKQ